MPQTMNELISEYVTAIRNIYGTHLKQVILYGSYARGDFNADSDVDIMLLVDLPEDKLSGFSDALAELGFDYNVEHDIWFMPVVKNIDHFNYWRQAYPFYSNVAKEDLDAAYVLLEAESYRGANNRAYYAIFHAVSAVLALEGIAFKRHKDTLGYFNKNYVAAEIFPREIGRKIVKAEEIRHASDYDAFYIASKEDTVQQVETADKLIQLLSDFCQNKNKESE